MKFAVYLFLQQVADDLSAVLAVGTVRDVHPVRASRVMLHDELVEVAVVHDPRHPLATLLDVAVDVDVCRLALDVLRVADTAHRLVQTRTAVAAADVHGFVGPVPQWLQYVVNQSAHRTHLVNTWSVDDAQLLGGC